MSEKRISESELVLNPDGSVYHLHLKAEHIADNVILVGDPDRVEQVSSFLDAIEFQVQNREFRTVTGVYRGKPFTVISSGIGTDNIDIVMNELDAAVNIDPVKRTLNPTQKKLNIVRIGTSGGLHSDIKVGSPVASSYGLGLDGLIYYHNFEHTDNEQNILNILNKHLKLNSNLASPYLAGADQHLLKLLAYDMVQGITVTATGFYGPQGRKLRIPLADEQMNHKISSFGYQDLRITNFEMETSALYGLGRLLGHRCCTCCVIIANRDSKQYLQDYKPAVNELITTVLQRLSS